jgi:hypothetical protein
MPAQVWMLHCMNTAGLRGVILDVGIRRQFLQAYIVSGLMGLDVNASLYMPLMIRQGMPSFVRASDLGSIVRVLLLIY